MYEIIYKITHSAKAIFLYVMVIFILSESLNVAFAAEDYLPDSVNIESKRERDKVDEIISKTFNKSQIDDFFYNSADSDYRPDTYSVDPSDYIVEYNVSETFFDDFATKDCNYSLLNQFISEYPTVYIPLYSQINEQSRVIGHCRIYYNVAEGRYVCRTSIMNTSSEEFQSGKRKHFYEHVQSYASTKEYDHILLIKLPTAFNDFSEKIALLSKSNGDLSVLDLYNSVNDSERQASEIIESKIYDYKEYAEFRKAAEQAIDSSEKAQAYGGARAGTNDNVPGVSGKAYIYILITAAIATVLAVSILIIAKHKKRAV